MAVLYAHVLSKVFLLLAQHMMHAAGIIVWRAMVLSNSVVCRNFCLSSRHSCILTNLYMRDHEYLSKPRRDPTGPYQFPKFGEPLALPARNVFICITLALRCTLRRDRNGRRER